MRKLVVTASIFACLLLFLYFACFAAISNLCTKYNNKKHIKIAGTEIIFSKIVPSITFNRIGIKIESVREEMNDFSIIHKDPIFIEINPFTFYGYIKYNGTAELISKQTKETYNIKSQSSVTFNFEYNRKIFKLLYEQKLFELVNFISTTLLEQKELTVSKSVNTEPIITSYNTKLLLLLTTYDYYKDAQSIEASPPKFYSLSANFNVKSPDTILMPHSIAYGLIPNFDIKGEMFVELDSKADKFDFNKPLDFAKIRLKCLKCQSSYLDIDTNSEADFTHNYVSIDASSKIILKELLFKKINSRYSDNKFFTLLLKDNMIKTLLDYTLSYSISMGHSHPLYDIRAKGKYSINDNSINTNIDHIIFKTIEGTGIMLNGKANINIKSPSDIRYNLNLTILTANTQNMINYWTQHFFRTTYYDRDVDEEVIKYNQIVNFNTAKLISEFPQSTSKELMFKVSIDSTQNNMTISEKNTGELIQTYYKVKYDELIKNAAKNRDPINYITKIAPELSSIANELLKNIPKGIKIEENLWKNLIK